MTSVIFISSSKDIPGPSFTSNGQSIVTSVVYQWFDLNYNLYQFTHTQNIRQHLNFFLDFLTYLPQFLFSTPIHLTYIVISRSPFGFIRDTILIFLLCIIKRPILLHFHGRTLPSILSKIFIAIFSFHPFKSRIHLLLPSSSFFHSNPSWQIFNHSEIPNFTEYTSSKPVQTRPCIQDNFTSNTYLSRKSALKLVWNSNLIYSKGILLLMEAIYIFNLYSPSHYIYLDIFGNYYSDEYCSSSHLESLFSEMSKRIPCTYHGSVDRSTTKSFLDESDFYIFPSFYSSEFQPLSVLDAIDCRLPIISSSLVVLKYLLHDYDQVYFLPDQMTPYAIASAIDSLVQARQPLPSSRPSNTYSKRFSRSTFLSSLSHLISSY